ncbi:putative germin-like protein 2-1 [Iris pallida]|uniref:Germin-like protein 2-1 n=1 Tax=Iris pallida TaxID=29817 RepID=A0AAX6I9U0_IRIPA|nr:putative germin-like protein 2-1 [Iris pallida]
MAANLFLLAVLTITTFSLAIASDLALSRTFVLVSKCPLVYIVIYSLTHHFLLTLPILKHLCTHSLGVCSLRVTYNIQNVHLDLHIFRKRFWVSCRRLTLVDR